MSTPHPFPEVDIEQPESLLAYLRAAGKIGPAETPRMTVLAGGVSNKVVLVELEKEAWVVKQALPKLRVKVDWFSDPARIHREADALMTLPALTPKNTIPDFIFDDLERHVLIMRAVPQPHDNWKTLLLQGVLKLEHVEQFATILATIQRRSAGLPQYAEKFGDRSFFESLRLEPYYAYTGTQVPEAADFMTALIADTRAQQMALVHGDYSPKNVLVYQDRLVLLDFEVIHYGDPAFDIGFAMTHLLSKAHHKIAKRRHFADAARHFWGIYSAGVGPTFSAPVFAPFADFEQRAVRHLMACLLARAAGRSPLEYLTPEEKARQIQAVLQFVAAPPARIFDFIEGFVAALD